MSDDPGDITVTIVNEQSLEVDEERIRDVALKTAAAEGASGELSIFLVTPGKIGQMNQRHLGERGPTDVLAFPIDGLADEADVPVFIGEVVVCPEVAERQAGGSLESEMDLLVAHGVLHLLGFDHDEESGAAAMRERELNASGRQGARAE
jgi:probable rRNA maturation factor